MTRTSILLTLATITMTLPAQTTPQTASQAAPFHQQNSFRFTLPIPPAQAAPFFGPEGERCWAGERWNPQFLHPQPAHDQQGAVFTVQHGPHTSIWVNTVFDTTAGRMQYVAVIPGVVATTIDVHLTSATGSHTAVEVTYARTALDPAMNIEVQDMSANDAKSGPEWQHSIEACLNPLRPQ